METTTRPAFLGEECARERKKRATTLPPVLCFAAHGCECLQEESENEARHAGGVFSGHQVCVREEVPRGVGRRKTHPRPVNPLSASFLSPLSQTTNPACARRAFLTVTHPHKIQTTKQKTITSLPAPTPAPPAPAPPAPP